MQKCHNESENDASEGIANLRALVGGVKIIILGEPSY